MLLFLTESNFSGCTNELIVHVLPQHAATIFGKGFEAVVGDVIEEVLMEYFEAAYSDVDSDSDS